MDLDLNDLIGNEEVATTTVTAPVAQVNSTPAPAPAPVVEAPVAEVVEAPAPVAIVEESAIGSAEVGVEVIEETATSVAATPSIKTTNLHEYFITYKNKITNATPIGAKFEKVPVGKHALFVTNEEDDASIYKIDNPNKLHLENVEPQSIIVEHSGVIITAENHRIYVGKTNTVQFDLIDGSPVRMLTFKKANSDVAPKVDVVDRVEKEMDVDVIKLHIKSVSPRLDTAVKDLKTKEEIKTATIAFLNEIRDINHLIKINESVMMECNL